MSKTLPYELKLKIAEYLGDSNLYKLSPRAFLKLYNFPIELANDNFYQPLIKSLAYQNYKEILYNLANVQLKKRYGPKALPMNCVVRILKWVEVQLMNTRTRKFRGTFPANIPVHMKQKYSNIIYSKDIEISYLILNLSLTNLFNQSHYETLTYNNSFYKKFHNLIDSCILNLLIAMIANYQIQTDQMVVYKDILKHLPDIFDFVDTLQEEFDFKFSGLFNDCINQMIILLDQ